MLIFSPKEMAREALVYRVLLAEEWFDQTQEPYAATVVAFLRQPKDTGGISVIPHPRHFWRRINPKIVQGIAELKVADICALTNPVTGESLNVWQNKEAHANILNAPFVNEYPTEANMLADDLASIARVWRRSEFADLVRSVIEARPSGLRASGVAWLTERWSRRGK